MRRFYPLVFPNQFNREGFKYLPVALVPTGCNQEGFGRVTPMLTNHKGSFTLLQSQTKAQGTISVSNPTTIPYCYRTLTKPLLGVSILTETHPLPAASVGRVPPNSSWQWGCRT